MPDREEKLRLIKWVVEEMQGLSPDDATVASILDDYEAVRPQILEGK